MTWFAVKGPDGEWVKSSRPVDDTKQWTWESAARHDPYLRSIATLSGAWWRKAERKGYRCVEVNLVEVNTTTAGEKGAQNV